MPRNLEREFERGSLADFSLQETYAVDPRRMRGVLQKQRAQQEPSRTFPSDEYIRNKNRNVWSKELFTPTRELPPRHSSEGPWVTSIDLLTPSGSKLKSEDTFYCTDHHRNPHGHIEPSPRRKPHTKKPWIPVKPYGVSP
eukprot:TRINITY_DN21571_c0_g1_i1.p1 TRINITY_DN21571_c0_g1~~TRINITY_DN21571_c0_g1_i1.p1  ORF type:complete len:156 (+),score=27.40 TRINITY_DN21571_c0_g1_i1:49-468(+)